MSKIDSSANSNRITRERWIHAALFFVGWIVWIFAIFSVSGCTFVKVHSDFSFGLFTYEGSEPGCLRYTWDSSDFSGSHKAAKAFGTVMLMCLTAAQVLFSALYLFLARREFSKMLFLVLRGLYPAAWFFNFFTFLMFAEDVCDLQGYNCSPGAAGVFAILNTLFLIAPSVLVFVSGSPTVPILLINPEAFSGDNKSSPRSAEKDEAVEAEAGQNNKEVSEVEVILDPTEEEQN